MNTVDYLNASVLCRFVVGAVDQGGLAVAQGFYLTARSNSAPTIDTINSSNVAIGTSYRYDVKARDLDGDVLSYAINQAAIDRGVSIDSRGRMVWTPQGSDLSNPVAVTVTVTDVQGASVTRSFNLNAVADVISPTVTIRATRTSLNIGESVTYEVRAVDNVSVAGLTLNVNGQAVALDGQGRATVQYDTAQVLNAVASAIDGAGNSGNSTPLTVTVFNPTIAFNPNVSFDLPDVVKAPTQFMINGDGLSTYQLDVISVNTGEVTTLIGERSIPTDGKVTFDPSLLLNDTYDVQLTVFGANGTESKTFFDTVNVEGELKLGNFRLSFTDLSVPVTGIPITLTRTYDTLTANQSDDFGYGWRMEFRDTDLRTSLGRQTEEEIELGRYPAFRDNTKVFITLPGGKREAFTFKANPVEEFRSGGERLPTGIFSNYLYEASFTAEKGSTNKLAVESGIFTKGNGSDRYYGFQGQPYNPADRLFGGVYVLTSQDGTKYRIDAASGDLLTVTDTNGNTLTYSDSEIKSSTGQKITFERDTQGRIVAVKDPMNEYVRYDYDANGDLVKVTDQERNVTQFVYDATYDDPNIAGVNDGGRSRKDHYLRSVIDPLNRVGARMDYDAVTGRLIKTTNAAGQTIETSYDPDNSIQVIKDAAGNPTEYEYDLRGNVVRQTNAIGATVTLKYDDNNNVIETRDAIGIVTKYEYDGRNNLLWKTEGYCGCAGGVPGKTYYTYDSLGNMTNLVLPTGASMVMDYDSKGQMLSMKDGLGNLIQAFTYYGNGLTKTETDSSGTSQYFYDDLGNLTRTVDPDGSATLMEYDFNGKLKRMVEDNGTPNDTTDDEVSTFDYDKLGREKLADYGDGIWVKYDYEGAGGDWSKLEAPTIGKMERKLTADGKLAGWVTPDGGTPTFIYDSAGRLWKETDATGQVTTEYTYDQVGRVSSVKDVQTGAVASKKYDLGNRVTEEIDPLLGFVRYEYYDARNGGKLKSTTRGQYIRNAAGNLVEDTTVALQTTSYEYNGSRTTVIDPLGRRTTAVQDEYALPTETIFENRNGKDYKTSQSYLYANNLQEAKDYPTRIVDIGGNDRKYTYDTTGRLETATDLGDGVYRYTYDENGETVKYFVSKVEK
jgi:YD repeat-containing protein